jgi:hypothetical protein
MEREGEKGMKFGNIIDAIHGAKFSAGIRAAFLSIPADYIRKNGTKRKIYVTPEPIDTATQYADLRFQDMNFVAKMQLFTLVLEEQNINFVTKPPEAGDMIVAEVGGVEQKWYVSIDASKQCWGYLSGNKAIWIFATTKKPKDG